MRKYPPPLEPEEVERLWQEYQQNRTDEIRHRLLFQYLGLIRYVLNNLNLPPNPILAYEDYLQFGLLGLNEAIERFDPNRDVKFETFAIPRIRGKILDEVRRYDWLSRTARKRSQEYLHAAEELRQKYKREVSSEEIREYLNLSDEEYQEYLRAAAAASYAASYYDPTWSEEGEEGESTNPLASLPSYLPTPQQELERKEMLEYVVKLLETLPERQRLIMTLYYYEELTFKEIGEILGITESRVSQLHSAILKTLREKITKRFSL